MTLRLGLRYDPVARPGAGPDDAVRLQRAIVAHARDAEARGADLVWLSERPFAAGAPVPAAFPLAAAIAAVTHRMRIAVGPLAIALHHPLRVAEDAASLDGLSGGRVELGLGLGENVQAFDAFDVATAERVARFEEGVALLRAAFAEGPIRLASRFCDATGLDVQPKPLQPAGIPLWLAADSPAAAARAGRLGDGLLCRDPALVTPFVTAWDEAGRPADLRRVSLELPRGPGPAADWIAAARGLLASAPAVDLVLPALPPDATPEASLDALDAVARALPAALRSRRDADGSESRPF
ncbi:MAG TPA: LLM class flavin-dependent oxidoreductase [Myxococcota bacterium]|nr:LLM class flavin-dependent oxidoreductase [Myxococcota bacterium]